MVKISTNIRKKMMEEQIQILQERIQVDESRINEGIKKLDNHWNEKNPEQQIHL